MPNVTMRFITHEEQATLYAPITEYSFRGSPPVNTEAERLERLQYNIERQIIVMFEDDTVVAAVGVVPMTQNVRGKIYGMGGIAPVATLPQARRKGYARTLMREQYKKMREQGFPFTGLHPFRESFYERMGYITFPQIRVARFNSATLTPMLRLAVPGEVSFGLLRDHFEEYRAYTLERQQHIHGMSYFPPVLATRMRDKDELWLATARRDGQVVGVMTYKITGFRETMQAGNFFYTDNAAKYLLLDWIARHTDHVQQVELSLPAYERAETWFSDMDIKFSTTDWVTAMGRVLDVAAIGGMTVGAGSFTALISDEYCDWNNGVFKFEADANGCLQVSQTQAAPDCSLTINGLSALIFGTHDAADFVWRGWTDGIPADTLAVMERMFPRAAPHMHEPY
jgi:predicted acetyltransferase